MISSDAILASEHRAADPRIPPKSTILHPPSKEGVRNFQCPQVGIIIECPITANPSGTDPVQSSAYAAEQACPLPAGRRSPPRGRSGPGRWRSRALATSAEGASADQQQ